MNWTRAPLRSVRPARVDRLRVAGRIPTGRPGAGLWSRRDAAVLLLFPFAGAAGGTGLVVQSFPERERGETHLLVGFVRFPVA